MTIKADMKINLIANAKQLINNISSKKIIDGRTIKKLNNDLIKIKQLPKLQKYIELLNNVKKLADVSTSFFKLTYADIAKLAKVVNDVKVERQKRIIVITPPESTYFITDQYNNQVELANFVTYTPSTFSEGVTIDSVTGEYGFETRSDHNENYSTDYPRFTSRDSSNSVANKIFHNNKNNNKDVMVTFYGTYEEISTGRSLFINEEEVMEKEYVYVPDFTYTKYLDHYILNYVGYSPDGNLDSPDARFHHIKYNNAKDLESLKGHLYFLVCKMLMSSGKEWISGIMETVDEIEPSEYDHRLRDGAFNCVLDCIRTQKTNFSQKDEIIINEFNDRYFKDGVAFSELSTITKKLAIEIEVYTKTNKKIYETKTKDLHRQIIKIQVENLDHACNYEELINKSDKEIVYVDNVDESFYKASSNLLMFKRGLIKRKIIDEKKDEERKRINEKNNINEPIKDRFEMVSCIKYFWDNTTLYKNKECEDYDNGKYYINNKIDLMNTNFEDINNLSNNNLYKNDNVELFNFINNSVHHVNEKYYNENCQADKIDWGLDYGLEESEDDDENINNNLLVDLSKYHAYDRNKHYVSFDKNEYYIKHQVPASGKFNFYQINKELSQSEINELLTKAGFCQIKNIKIENKAINKLKYFIDGYIYSMPIIEWMINNNIKFDIVAVAFNNWKQELIFNEEMKTTKEFYTKFIGIMSINNEFIEYNMKCSSITEYKDLKFRDPDAVKRFDDKNNCIVIQEKNNNIYNKAHVSSYILSYAMIEILDKLTKIDYSDLIGVKVDCIITKKAYDNLFVISKLPGDYKMESKENKNLSNDYTFINPKNLIEYKIEHVLTNNKLFYKNINFISGSAGSGKTSRFYKKFTNQDETIDTVFAFPNNNLCGKFKNEGHDNIKAYTYHKIFNIGIDGDTFDKDYLSAKYINVILDEVTMIGACNIAKIIKEANFNKINLFFVGDYNITTKQIYQMNPVQDKSFLNYKFDYKKSFILNLKTNYRQGADIQFGELLNLARGETNDKVLKSALDSNMFKTIKYNEMIDQYKIDDIIITPFKNGGSESSQSIKINNVLLNKFDVVNCKFNGPHVFNNKLCVNSEDIRLSKEEYLKHEKNLNIAYCQTSHLVQGLEYDKEKIIYIIKERFFTENQLYVILSRAKQSNQIIFVDMK